MPYSEDTKTELGRIIPKARCCRLAELSAFYDFNGYLMGNGRYLDFNHSSPLASRKTLVLLKNLYPEIHTRVFVKRSKLRRNQICAIRVNDPEEAQLIHADLLNQSLIGESQVLRRKCCRRAYLRGAFLSNGSITNPEKTYHLEISSENTQIAERLLQTISKLDLDAKITMRKGNYLVYLKNGEQIVTFLNLIGAHKALLSFENTRIVKEMRNQVNRLVNCETANVDKTVQAALMQIADIRKIQRHMDLKKLPPKLYQVAKLRLENPYASLRELGELAVPKMSKSGINYRIKQLHSLSTEIQP